MASRAHYRIEHVATVPYGWKVRTVESGTHRVRIAFPPGRRQRGAGHVVEILHPKHENPCPGGARLANPAELVLMGANPIEENPRRKFSIGESVTFHGYDGENYQGTIAGKYKRGYSVDYYVPRLGKTVTTHLPTAEASKRLRGENPTRSEKIRAARERGERIRETGAQYRNPHGKRWAIRWHTGNISQAFNSEAEAKRMLDNFHGKGELIRVNPMPAHSERYRNPISAEAAEAIEIREGFTHHDARGYRVADEPLIPAGDYAELGTSGYVQDEETGERAEAYLAVKPTKGGYRLQLTLDRRGVTFLSDTSRRQIYIAGRFVMPLREIAQFTDAQPVGRVALGECVGIGYIAVKYHPQIENRAAGKRILWEHQFGEETGVCPSLIYDAEQERLALEGGAYRVEDAGIIN